jgi:hypothetical protein
MALSVPLQPLTSIPVSLLTSATAAQVVGVQAPSSYMREFHESREIHEDIQRGTLTHVFMVAGHPTEALMDMGLSGMNIGSPHPWWQGLANVDSRVADLVRDMYLVDRTFSKVSDSSDITRRWTEVRLTYKKVCCPFSYEEDFQTTSTTMQVWWTRDPADETGMTPVKVPISLSEGYSIQVPQYILRRHWPHVIISEANLDEAKTIQLKRNYNGFRGEPKGVWLCESVQSKRLYGSGSDPGVTSETLAHYEITITWRGDPVRQHELWIALLDSGGVLPKRPTSMSFEHLAAVHQRTQFYALAVESQDFNDIFVQGAVQRCKP